MSWTALPWMAAVGASGSFASAFTWVKRRNRRQLDDRKALADTAISTADAIGRLEALVASNSTALMDMRKQYDRELTALRVEIQVLREQLAAARQEMDDLRAARDTWRHEAERLQEEQQQSDDDIAALRDRIALLEEAVATKDDELKSKEVMLAALTQQLLKTVLALPEPNCEENT